MKPSGSLLFKDEYDQLYTAEWNTVNGVLDITSVVGTPYIWGEEQSGYIQDNVLYRKGIITVTRLVLKPIPGGYEIVAEGVSQFEDFIQMTYPCETGPVDIFKYHLDRLITDWVESVVTIGPHWADPNNSTYDDDMLWGDVALDGSPVGVAGTEFEFIDVWS